MKVRKGDDMLYLVLSVIFRKKDAEGQQVLPSLRREIFFSSSSGFPCQPPTFMLEPPRAMADIVSLQHGKCALHDLPVQRFKTTSSRTALSCDLAAL